MHTSPVSSSLVARTN